MSWWRYDRFPSSFVAGAVAELMADGFLADHIRRMRRRYRAGHDAAVEAIERVSLRSSISAWMMDRTESTGTGADQT